MQLTVNCSVPLDPNAPVNQPGQGGPLDFESLADSVFIFGLFYLF